MDAEDERDRLADFLSRYRIGGEPMTTGEARAAAQRMLGLADLDEAELTAHGFRQLTVVHGAVETAEQEAAVHQLWSWGDRHPGAVTRTVGTNDTTTWLLAPPDAERHLAALEAVAQEHNPGWWTIRRAGR